MLSSLLRPRKSRRLAKAIFPASPSPVGERQPEQEGRGSRNSRRKNAEFRHATADWTETEGDVDDSDDNQGRGQRGDEYEDSQGEEEDEGNEENADEDGDENTPLLPLFSAAHLGLFCILNLCFIC